MEFRKLLWAEIGVHSTPPGELVSLCVPQGRRVEEFPMLRKPRLLYGPKLRESFLKWLSGKEQLNWGEFFFSCNNNKTYPEPKGSPRCHSPSLTHQVCWDQSVSNPRSPGCLQGSWCLTLVAHTPLLSAMGNCLPCFLVCILAFPLDTKNIRHSRGGLRELKAGEFSVTWGGNPSKAEFTLCLATTRCQQLIWFQFPKQSKGRRTHEEGKEGLGPRWLFVCQVGLQEVVCC